LQDALEIMTILIVNRRNHDEILFLGVQHVLLGERHLLGTFGAVRQRLFDIPPAVAPRVGFGANDARRRDGDAALAHDRSSCGRCGSPSLNSLNSKLSTNASQLASMMFSLTP